MKKRKRLLVILSTFVMAAQPMCVAAEMQDAEGFGAVEEIWADEGLSLIHIYNPSMDLRISVLPQTI